MNPSTPTTECAWCGHRKHHQMAFPVVRADGTRDHVCRACRSAEGRGLAFLQAEEARLLKRLERVRREIERLTCVEAP